ncbi:MAG: hypothetical protein AB7H48_07010 [Parachlamydiales bacterium]
MSIRSVSPQDGIQDAAPALNAGPAADLNGIGSARSSLSRASVNSSADDEGSRCCGCFNAMISGFNRFASSMLRTVKRWIWGVDQKLASLERLNSAAAEQGVARDQIVRDFAALSPDMREVVKLTMWQLASQENALPADHTNWDWAGRVIQNQVRQGDEAGDRADIAQFIDLAAAQSLFRRAMDAVIGAMQEERRGSAEVEVLKTLAGTAGAVRLDIQNGFDALPAETQLKIKYSMWALAGQQIDPSSPQPYDRCDGDDDWAGRIIRNEVQMAPETDDRADIAHHIDLAADGSIFRQALEIVAMGEAALSS